MENRSTAAQSQPAESRKIGVLPCSGACNVGMMTTRAVVEIASNRPDVGFVCALGLPLGIPGIIEMAKKADYYIALNCRSQRLRSEVRHQISGEGRDQVGQGTHSD